VQLDFDTGPFSAGTVLCLNQLLGGCVAGPDACANDHVHLTISISGVSGEFVDQNQPECGQGSVITYNPGCGGDKLPACSSSIPLVVDLTDLAVVPPSGSGQSGQCFGSMSSDQSSLGFSCSHDVADVTDAHIHRAPAGSNGLIVTPLGATPTTVFGTLPMSPTDVYDLQAAHFYVDLHSAAFLDGAVRGQIHARSNFNFPLAPGQEVPPPGSGAVGACTTALSADRTQLDVSCMHDVVNPTAAHIHRAAPGMNGPIVFDLGNGVSPISTTVPLTVPDAVDLLAGLFYVNVHSVGNSDGELRGQIVRD